MLEKKSFRQLVALTLVIVMVFSLLPSKNSYAAENYDDSSAESVESDSLSEDSNVIEEESETKEEEAIIIESEPTDITEETTEETTEAVTETPEVTSEEEITTEEATTEETTEVEESEIEEEAEETSAEVIPTFTQIYDGVDVSGKDFSSCELLIATGDASIFTADTEVVSEYNGIYLTRYADSEQTKSAYTYYYTKANLVEPNTSFKGADGEEGSEEDISEDDGKVSQQEEVEVSENTDENSEEEEVLLEDIEIVNDGHGEADLSEINTGNDAFSNVNDLSAIGGADIALIDSGASGSNIVGAVSVLCGGTGDDNGHGTKMYNAIINQNPNARILSIKALDSSNRGQASDIYAAIQYAIDSNVRIINLSLASISSSDSHIVVDAINEAIGRGITVVGAAGNYGSNASYFIPGCVGGVITCAATDSDGKLLTTSNYGSAIDYYVVADSTSEAAATVSGLISRDGLEFSSEIVRTEESVIATDTDATETDAVEMDVEDERSPEEVEERSKIEQQAKLDRDILIDNPWLNHGQFVGQIDPNGGRYYASTPPAGYPSVIMANCTATVKERRANSSHVIGTVNVTDVYSMDNGCNINNFVYDKPVNLYCNCDWEGIASTPHSYYNTANGTLHQSGGGSWDHLCRVPTPSDNAIPYDISIPATAFIYSGQSVNIGGQTYYRYFTVDYASGFSGAGYQDIRMIMDIRLNTTPGYVSLHKTAIDKSGNTISNPLSFAGIKYGLFRNLSGTEEKLAEFTLGADGWPVATDGNGDGKPDGISVVGSSAGSRDIPIIRDGHAYLQWYSDVSPQNWYFREISTNDNYFLDSTSKIDAQYNNNNAIKVAEPKDKMVLGMVEVFKFNPNGSGNNGYGLAGAVFTIKQGNTKIADITTNNDGYAKYEGLRPGSYSIQETKAPDGYQLDSTLRSFTIKKSGENTYPTATTDKSKYQTWARGISGNNSLSVKLAQANKEIDIRFRIKKTSANPSCTTNNPNYELSGARFAIYRDPDSATNAINTKNYNAAIGTLESASSGLTDVFDVTSYMNRSTSTGEFQTTYFYVIETAAPKNYRLDKTVHRVQLTKNDYAAVKEVTFADTPVNDPSNISVVKQFKGDHTEPLSGAEFTVNFYAQPIENNYTFEQLNSMRANWSDTFTTASDGIATIRYNSANGLFPIGYITIEETKAPEGFKLDGSVTTIDGTEVSNKMAIVLTSNGNAEEGYTPGGAYIVNDDGTRGISIFDTSAATVSNPIVVGEEEESFDFEIKKECGDDGTPIEAATFEIKNNDTGEVHTFKTDDKGYYSSESSYLSHSAPNGMWFVNGPQNIVRDVPDDDSGALVRGSYTVTEIDAAGHQKEEPITFEAKEDGMVYTLYDDGRGDGLKVISDMELPTLGTLALVELFADGSSPTDEEYEEIMKNFDGTADSLPEGTYKVLPATEGQKITDVCHYKNLRFDTDYTLYGRLMQIGKDGSVTPFKSGGKEVTGITNFHTPETYEKSQYDSCGYATVRFTDLDFTDIQDTSFVVFESLYIGNLTEEDITSGSFDTSYVGLNNDTVTFPINHEDASDKNQTVTTPDGRTQALSEDGTKTVSVLNKHFVINDTCSYKGLIKGHKYTITGYVYKKPIEPKKNYSKEELEALRAKDKNGEYITGSTTFVAEKSEGSVVIKFEFDMDYEVQKKAYVVGERCYDEDSGNILMFAHEDVSDQDQSFYEPVISTQTKKAESCIELCLNEGKFIDTVFIENTEPNAEFTIKGKVMDKDTGKELLLNGKPVTASTSITTGDPTNSNGSTDGYYDIEFVLSEDQIDELNGKNIVVYEYLYNKGGTLISKHEDLDDIEQSLKFVKIGTIAKDAEDTDNEKLLKPDGKYKLVDSVSFSNIELNHEYTLNGTIMRKDTGLPLLDKNGNEIKASTKFTPKTESGSVDVIFEFETDVVDLDIVVFEEMTIETGVKSIPVGYHRDINSKDQTVRIGSKGRLDLDKNNKGRGRSGRTGDNIPLIPVVAVMLTALVGGIIIISRKKRTN